MVPSQSLVRVAITSDLMCPWCYIGLRKLQIAARETNIPVEITWKPYMLRPGMPESGTLKGGTPESRVPLRLKQEGQSVGINFTGLTDRTPSTQLFHAVMHVILEKEGAEKQTEFHEVVFDQYFTKGVYRNRDAMLVAASQVGVSGTVKAFFEDPGMVEETKEEIDVEARAASRRGISGVPFFEFNDEPAFSGAQDVETFKSFLIEHAK